MDSRLARSWIIADRLRLPVQQLQVQLRCDAIDEASINQILQGMTALRESKSYRRLIAETWDEMQADDAEDDEIDRANLLRILIVRIEQLIRMRLAALATMQPIVNANDGIGMTPRHISAILINFQSVLAEVESATEIATTLQKRGEARLQQTAAKAEVDVAERHISDPITLKQVAQYLGISAQTLRNLKSHDPWPPPRINQKGRAAHVYSFRDLVTWLVKHYPGREYEIRWDYEAIKAAIADISTKELKDRKKSSRKKTTPKKAARKKT